MSVSSNGRFKVGQVFEVTGRGIVRLHVRRDQVWVLKAGDKVQVVSSDLTAFFRSRSDFKFVQVKLAGSRNHRGLIHFASFNAAELKLIWERGGI